MFVNRFKLAAAGLVGCVISLFVMACRGSFTQFNLALEPSIEKQILNATVQIRLYTPPTETEKGAGYERSFMAIGLGTLAFWEGEAVIITHDHWSFLEKAEFVEIYDAQGELQQELSGADFRALIRYRDQGTLILSAPMELVASHAAWFARIGNSNAANPGDTVILVHQAMDGSDRLAVMVADVISITEYRGMPLITLGCKDGVTLIPGDSGGGIWLNQQLVGNMWARENEKAGKVGYAAIFPMQSRP